MAMMACVLRQVISWYLPPFAFQSRLHEVCGLPLLGWWGYWQDVTALSDMCATFLIAGEGGLVFLR
jgi:hypothetical protein